MVPGISAPIQKDYTETIVLIIIGILILLTLIQIEITIIDAVYKKENKESTIIKNIKNLVILIMSIVITILIYYIKHI